MKVSVGMDVHPKRSQVAIVDDAGVPQRNRDLANDPAKLIPVLGALAPGTPVALEAADGWAGWSSCSKSWSGAAPGPSQPRQGNRLRSVKARQGRRGHVGAAAARRSVARAWTAPQQVRDLRALLGHRASLVRLSTSGQNRVQAVLADRGIGEDRGRWTGPGRAGLADLELPPIPGGIIQDCGGLLDALATPIGRLDHQIAALAKPDPRVQALMVLAGSAS
jgi:transposase